jgi:hypothetical protein
LTFLMTLLAGILPELPIRTRRLRQPAIAEQSRFYE